MKEFKHVDITNIPDPFKDTFTKDNLFKRSNKKPSISGKVLLDVTSSAYIFGKGGLLCESTGEKVNTYKQYLSSRHWKQFKKKFKESKYSNGCCLICNRDRGIHIHHLRYDTLGNESFIDVVELCSLCHRNVHMAMKKGVTWTDILFRLKEALS